MPKCEANKYPECVIIVIEINTILKTNIYIYKKMIQILLKPLYCKLTKMELAHSRSKWLNCFQERCNDNRNLHLTGNWFKNRHDGNPDMAGLATQRMFLLLILVTILTLQHIPMTIGLLGPSCAVPILSSPFSQLCFSLWEKSLPARLPRPLNVGVTARLINAAARTHAVRATLAPR